MNVTKILNLAKVYSSVDWQTWGSSDLSEIHQLLTELAQKHAVKYEIEIIQDEPASLEKVTHKSKAELLHDLLTEAMSEGNLYGVREMLEQMLVVGAELIEDEKSKC